MAMSWCRVITVLFIPFCMLSCRFMNIEAAPQASLVKTVPGFSGTFPSKHYAGYITIDDGDKKPPKNLYYYYVVSERNPATDPVVLWLNGGPGCSSFDGFVYEHGPFNFEAAKREGGLPNLHLNPYSWSKVSNMIYLDSPAGVGFSYSANTSTYENGDIQTASDTHSFLLKWFEQYPEFVGNEFYLAGESFAGIYVPTLASAVDKGIKSGVKPVINFKGYMIGNGVCDNNFDGISALVPFTHGMGLISDQFYKAAETACKGNYHDVDTYCTSALTKIAKSIDDLNIYNILEPCYHSRAGSPVNTSSKLPKSFKELGMSSNKPLGVRKRIFGRAWPFRAPVEDGIVPLWPQLMENTNVPCMDDTLATLWLNDKQVRNAIHADPESGEWSLCTSKLRYNHDAGSMISYHKNLTAKGYYKVLIYSGDHDMCVPFTGTQAWTQSLGYQIIDEWRPWNSNGQTAGFTQGYANNFRFLTIKGAGHTVPEYKPRESLDFYSRWIQGQNI